MTDKNIVNYHTPFESNVYYHETIQDWLHRLRVDDTLDTEDKLNLIVLINNWISKDMKWKFTYLIDYNYNNYMITLSGFPKFGFPDYFTPEKLQLHWLLNRIGYYEAIVYLLNNEVTKIELIYDKTSLDKDLPSLVIFRTVDEEKVRSEQEAKDNCCNILSTKSKNCEQEINDNDKGVDNLDI
ncbi:hypothetical protein [Methanosphaera sp.]|jgi:hypothetical protein|uniref:hypothetical protein n=1 Tax=Methanosphaera sp. TaxID=2666342 RepID=UPI003D8AD1A6